MDAEYATRRQQLLEECQVAPEIFDQVMARLETFMVPFVSTFRRQEPSAHAHTYVRGLLSEVERKNVASIAYRFGQDRLPLPRFSGWAEWDEAPLRQELTRHVAEHLGHADGVWVCDPSGFAKSGPESVGVARQWCGRLGKVDTCQVAVYLGYVSGEGQPLVAMRLSLPKAWTQAPARLDKAGVPHDRRGDRSRHQWALNLLQERGALLPHGWIAGDDERGRPYGFRRRLAHLGERSLRAVPGNTLRRDLETAPPESSSRGRRPKRPWQRIEQWSAGLADYEVRHWTGWHPHQTLSLIATWFLVTATRRGKKMDTRHDVTSDSGRYRVDAVPGMSVRNNVPYAA